MKIESQELEAAKLSPDRLAEAVQTFRETGLLVLEDIYSLDFITQVNATFEVALNRHIRASGGLDAMIGKTFGANHISFFPPLFLPLADSRLSAHPLVVQVLKALLGDDVQSHFYHSNVAYPGSGYQPIHRDGYASLFPLETSVAHPVSDLVLNIPLCDFTEENGSTEVWPGTHLICDETPEDALKLEARAAALPAARMNLRRGSLALRDLRVWHRGMPNKADYPRAMYSIVYRRGWLIPKPMHIPRSTWNAWPEDAKGIFRNNKILPDSIIAAKDLFRNVEKILRRKTGKS